MLRSLIIRVKIATGAGGLIHELVDNVNYFQECRVNKGIIIRDSIRRKPIELLHML